MWAALAIEVVVYGYLFVKARRARQGHSVSDPKAIKAARAMVWYAAGMCNTHCVIPQ